MRQLTYRSAGVVAWEEVPEPDGPGPTGALVRPLAVARCDLDLPMAAFGLFPGPFPVGHEIAAEVIAVGTEVQTHRRGDRVVVPFQVSCGACRPCARRTFAACGAHRAPLGASFGFGPSGGGFGGGVTDVLAVPHADHLLVAAPAGTSPVVLANLSDNVADAYRAVAPMLREEPDRDVLILSAGIGAIPLYAAGVAVALGAPSVRYVDCDPERVAIAARLGATASLHEGQWPKRFDPAAIVVESVGEPAGLQCALRSTEPYGTCTTVSVSFEPVTLPVVELYTRGVTFHASRADGRRLLPEVLDLVASGRFDPLSIPTTVVDWGDAAEAWLAPATKLVVAR
ncbi:MAG: alcohol dehydrogenase catalytic domain-containing protein [Acidimicrobiales bacterium]